MSVIRIILKYNIRRESFEEEDQGVMSYDSKVFLFDVVAMTSQEGKKGIFFMKEKEIEA
jgi:hypothetical protein